MKKRKFANALLVSVLSIGLVLAGCSNNKGNESSGSASPDNGAKPSESAKTSEDNITLKLAFWDVNNDFIDYWTDKVKEFTDVHPNIKVEAESFKNDGDYLQAMKVRLAGKELPDVFALKPNFLNDFKTELLPLDGMGLLENNQFAEKFAIDGQVLAVPTISFPELVYYHPSIFEELNLEIPTTWGEFVDTLKAIEENSDYIPYSMGGKDAWPNYPFNEFMPLIESGSETYLSDIAKEDQPFGEGTPFYTSYSKIEQLYEADVMGPDPLGVSWDQATGLFQSKQAAVMAAGLWYLSSHVATMGNTDDLAAFPLPVRESKDEPLKVMTFTDHFYGINKESKHTEAAKLFLEWMYSPEVYQTYLEAQQIGSTFEGVKADVPFLNQFYDSAEMEFFTYVPGDEAYTNLINVTQLDWKKIGQEMMAGKKMPDIAKEWNDKWSKARQ